MIIPGIVIKPPKPNPEPFECSDMLVYVTKLIGELEAVLETVYSISNQPDESMLLIQKEVKLMIANAKTVKSNLRTIYDKAFEMEQLYNKNIN